MVVYRDDFIGVRVHVVGKQGDEFVFPYVHICDYPCLMMYGFSPSNLFGEHNLLYAYLHKAVGSLVHRVAFDRVFERFLHLWPPR